MSYHKTNLQEAKWILNIRFKVRVWKTKVKLEILIFNLILNFKQLFDSLSFYILLTSLQCIEFHAINWACRVH